VGLRHGRPWAAADAGGAGTWRDSGHSEVYYYRAMLAGVGLSVSAACDSSLACRPEWRDEGTGFWTLGREGGSGSCREPPSRRQALAPERYALVADQLSREKGASVAVLGAAAERAWRSASRRSWSQRRGCCAGRPRSGARGGPRPAPPADHQRLRSHASGRRPGVPVVAVFGPTDWRRRRRVGRFAVWCGSPSPAPLQATRVPDRPSLHAAHHRRPRAGRVAGPPRGSRGGLMPGVGR